MARELPKMSQQQQKTIRPTHDEIARRAYEIFLERGSPEGRDQEHWYAAESELSGLTAARQARPAPAAKPGATAPRK
ncbi:MAG: DUF2934 domain-containing protein [Verrucomicrobiota bacterium]